MNWELLAIVLTIYIVLGTLRLDFINQNRDKKGLYDLETVNSIIIVLHLDLFWKFLKSCYKLLVKIGNWFESLFK